MNILIVCTGNTCRSPMAEAILRKAIKESGRRIEEYSISSAGISTANGMSASENSIEALKEIGIDLSNHKSKVITKKLIDESDIILTMTKSHKEILVQAVPKCKEKVYTFKGFANKNEEDISDPFGGNLDIYRNTMREIMYSVNEIVKKI
ncbi:TPA: low molecular weight protein arginine phosphatase [Clostridioides difficile]|uniref:low molecular weight protein arginine phosphatase n=1 Tax=Clostridioides difficile TaxID=1496 RepID=UPI000AD6CBFE|nr:low molecular weight protein arginine phosphatase [Clostridioides difficile]MBH7048252.1 low molecular weight protein arginine phosphatase [Clostridioides difficile]MBS7775158.1 low molecular weight protein arginine phosphatase [Clostridioides difficile]PBH39481.1 protein tyrosine phosphatase [Clostridioides difficile]QXF93582.1 low molecular weight protein arginine phosphatase [Clostridioides difficile]VFB52710.1 protein-tyrosine phosphatase reductase [Clostridioides difficile]